MCWPTIWKKNLLRICKAQTLGYSLNIVLRAGYLSVQEVHLIDSYWRHEGVPYYGCISVPFVMHCNDLFVRSLYWFCCRKWRWRRVFCRTRHSTVVSGFSQSCFIAWTAELLPRHVVHWWWEDQAVARRLCVVSLCGRPLAHVLLVSLSICSPITSVRPTMLRHCRLQIFFTVWLIRSVLSRFDVLC